MDRRFRWALAVSLLISAQVGAQDSLGRNALANGGFEAGREGWWHPKEQYGGTLDPARRHGGVNSWRMDLDRPEKDVMVSHGGPMTRGRDHQVSVWIRCVNVAPADAIRVRVLQFAARKPVGWYVRHGKPDVVHTGGSHDWYRFCFNIPASALREDTDRLTVFLRAAAGATGAVWFDDVSLRPITGKPPGELLDAQGAPPLDMSAAAARDDAAAFRDIPFLDPVGKGVEIDCGSDHNLFYGPSPAKATIKIKAEGNVQLDWIVTDYFGRRVHGGRAKGTAHVTIREMGYFEIAARLTRDGEQTGAARTSLAHLPTHPFASTTPGYSFGSWVQQNDLLDDIGARWTRVGPGWRYLEPKRGQFREHLWQRTDTSLRSLAAKGIEPIFLFAKVPKWAGPHYKRVAPDHWDDLRAYVRKCITRYRDQVDVWEVMNEPYIPTLFPGTLDEVMQWHRIVREEVDRNDPGGKVIGPCLNTRPDYLFKEMRQLLELGIGDLIDGVSIHTYGGLEAAGFLDHFVKLRKLLDEFNANKPLYITEQGLSMPEELPLERVQAQYLTRMALLCMQADVRAVIWHMMSWPQGGSPEQRSFAIVRARKGTAQRAPRPAFAAAATLASVLGKARFVRTITGLGDKVGAQVFDAAGKPVLVLWDWGQPERQIQLNVGVPEVTVVNIVGARRMARATQGRLKLTITPNPVYILGAKASALLR